jgi:hypothetical protein
MPDREMTLETAPTESLDERLQALADSDLEMIRGGRRPRATFDNGFDNSFDNSFHEPISPSGS